MTVPTCPHDRTPLVSTFERPGSEWHCLACGRYLELLAAHSAAPVPELVRRADQLAGLFAAGERGPLDLAGVPTPAASPPSDSHIKCDGCGADSGRTPAEGKPSVWYARTRGGATQHACSRACIDLIATATGTDRIVLPW